MKIYNQMNYIGGEWKFNGFTAEITAYRPQYGDYIGLLQGTVDSHGYGYVYVRELELSCDNSPMGLERSVLDNVRMQEADLVDFLQWENDGGK